MKKLTFAMLCLAFLSAQALSTKAIIKNKLAKMAITSFKNNPLWKKSDGYSGAELRGLQIEFLPNSSGADLVFKDVES